MANRVVWWGGKPMNIRVSVFPHCFFVVSRPLCCWSWARIAAARLCWEEYFSIGSGAPGKSLPVSAKPDGYYEWDAVVAVHERLPIDLQRWWPASEDTIIRGLVAASSYLSGHLSSARW